MNNETNNNGINNLEEYLHNIGTILDEAAGLSPINTTIPDTHSNENINSNELVQAMETFENAIEDFNSNNNQDITEQNIAEDSNSTEEGENTGETTNIEILLSLNTDLTNIDIQHSRFSGAVWFNEVRNLNISLIGLGGINSWTVLLLAKLNPTKIHGYDDDIVETANLSGQLYSINDVDDYKGDSILKTCRNYASYYDFKSHRLRINGNSFNQYCPEIVICGVDNMETRKEVFDKWVSYNSNRDNTLFIDGRLSATTLQVFCIQGNDSEAIEKYAKDYLFSDEEADETICSFKQTAYMASMIGSVITNVLVNWVSLTKCDSFRIVPFMTEYDSETMSFKTY